MSSNTNTIYVSEDLIQVRSIFYTTFAVKSQFNVISVTISLFLIYVLSNYFRD